MPFSKHCCRELQNDAGYLRCIVFSDKCQFSFSRRVNKQNCRVWGTEHPQRVYECPRSALPLIVLCARSESDDIGHYFSIMSLWLGVVQKHALFCVPTFPPLPCIDEIFAGQSTTRLSQPSQAVFGREAFKQMDRKGRPIHGLLARQTWSLLTSFCGIKWKQRYYMSSL